MAMSFFLSTTSSASLLPFRRESAVVRSLFFTRNARGFLSLSRIPPNPPCFSRIPTSCSCKTPTSGALSSVATASRTLLYLLAASLLSLSGVRPPPALASVPPPTQQQQEIEEQDEQLESHGSKVKVEEQESEEIMEPGEEQESEESKEQCEEQVEENKEQCEEQESEESKEQCEEQESEESKEQGEYDVKKSEEIKEREEEFEADDEVKMYSAILSRNPGDVDALKCLLYAKMRRVDWDGALRYARRLRVAEPGEVEWRLMEAQLHELRGDLAEAERLFRDVLAEDPLLIRALHGLTLCMRKRLEGPSAFEILENALQLAVSEKRVPDERNIKLLIAQMHVVMGQLDVAAEKLQNLINEDPRDFRPHLCQGIVYALLDKKGEADVQFDIYRSLVPDEFPDRSFINDIIQAAKMDSNGRIQKEFGSEFVGEK